MEVNHLQVVSGLTNLLKEAQGASSNHISEGYRTRKNKNHKKERNSFKFYINVVGRDSLTKPAQVCRRITKTETKTKKRGWPPFFSLQEI